MKNPVIIGAGGVASYLLPALIKTFRPDTVTLIDKDILEERNLDRQLFNAKFLGSNKAQALCDTIITDKDTVKAQVIQDWFTESTKLPDETDAIICCADNHEARRNAIRASHVLSVHAYIGGNEYLDSQAFVYHPQWEGTQRDPLKRYPAIVTSNEGSPIRCTGEAQEASPQLAIANLSCAAKLLHLLWIYERWVPENYSQLTPETRELLPFELFTSLTENSVLP